MHNTVLKLPLLPTKTKAVARLLRPPAETILRVLVYRAILLGPQCATLASSGGLRDGAARTYRRIGPGPMRSVSDDSGYDHYGNYSNRAATAPLAVPRIIWVTDAVRNGTTSEIGVSGTFLDFLPNVLWDSGGVWLLTGR